MTIQIAMAVAFGKTELARRLDVIKQVISRYRGEPLPDRGDCQGQEILDAIGIKTAVTLTA